MPACPRVFIGTMYCGENEIDQCIEAIFAQKNVDITHFRVDNKPEQAAHQTLYNKWNSVKSDYDMFVQIDADTVLTSDVSLHDLYNVLEAKKQEDYTSIQTPLLDFLTDSLIYGLNCYSVDVQFVDVNSSLYCDRCTQNNKTFLLKTVYGTHAPNPRFEQCFHYGVHRGLKNQRDKQQLVLSAYKKNPLKQRGYALIGFHVAKQLKSFNYDDQEFIKFFKDVKDNYDHFVRLAIQ
jgi:hypothetical protein